MVTGKTDLSRVESGSVLLQGYVYMFTAAKIVKKQKRTFINPIALRKANIVYNFGLIECNRVISLETFNGMCYDILIFHT